MSFFDSILGLNTTKNTNAGTQSANDFLAKTGGLTENFLRDTTASAGDLARGGVSDALSAILRNYGGSRSDLTAQNANARDALGGGVAQATGTLAPYVTSGANAGSMFSNALGLNGAAGNDAARGAFQAGPGYEWQRDQATDAVARKAASLGIAGSGNTMAAINDRASNLANGEYGSWLDRLNGLSTQGQAAAGQTAGYQYGGGQGAASLFQNLGTSLGSLGVSQGGAEGNLQSTLGNTLANQQTGLGQNLASNIWHGVDQTTANTIGQGKAADTAQNTNNKIFGDLFNKVAGVGLSAIGL